MATRLLKLEKRAHSMQMLSNRAREIAGEKQKTKDQEEADAMIATVANRFQVAFKKRERRIEIEIRGHVIEDPPFFDLSGPYELVRQWAEAQGFRTGVRKKASARDPEYDEYFLVLALPEK